MVSGIAIGLDVSAEPPAVQRAPPADDGGHGADGVLRAAVAVDTYFYKPDHLIAVVGHPVELTLKSVTIIVPHNFLIKAPELGVEINQEVPAGKAVTVRFTPTHPGKTKFYCNKKLLFFKSHEEKGMKGTLEVRENEDSTVK